MTATTPSAELEQALARVAELEQEAERYRIILEHVPGYVAQLTPEGNYVYLNRFAPGFTQADIAGKGIFDLIAPSDHAAVKEAIATVHRTHEPCGRSFIAPGANGKATRFYQTFAPVLEGTKIASLVVLATDTSSVVNAFAALEESDAKLRIAVAAAQIGFWTFDPESEQESTTDARTRALLGAAEDATLAERFAAIHPEDLEPVKAELAEALGGKGTFGPLELRTCPKEGTLRWLEARGSVVRGSDGRARVVGSIVDISERKRLEARLAQESKMESIGRLAGGIAHDFNNMLTAILGFAEIARQELPPSMARDAVDQISRAAKRSAELTAQLLTFARKQTITPRVLNINALIVQVEALLRRLLGEPIEIVTVLRATRLIRVDPGQFERLLVNLATNARDAMPEGGRLTLETMDVTLTAEDVAGLGLRPARPEGVRLCVRDEGQGIPAKHIPYLFEPFFTTKPVGQGTGLGLATVHGVVAQHGGHIAVESCEGRGTTFLITLPSATESTAALQGPSPKTEARGACQHPILLVEDEPQVREVLATVLARQGYHVIEAADGREALTKTSDLGLPIELVITDLVMPGIGGRQLVETLRRSRNGLRALYISGYEEQASRFSNETAVSSFLRKPFSVLDLLAEVRNLLTRE